jgi:hypothetical protein
MRIAIVGSRGYRSLELVRSFVDHLPKGTIVVSGGARGVDETAEAAALDRGFEVESWRPINSLGVYQIVRRYDVGEESQDELVADVSFRTFGQAAYWRNRRIVGSSDYVAAFWDGKSKGTMHTMDLAAAAGKLIDPTRPGPFPWELADQPDRREAVTRPRRRSSAARS